MTEKEEDFEEEIIENQLDYEKWKNDPASRRKFRDINKDLPMSNLSDHEVFLVRNFGDFMKQLDSMGLEKAKEYFEFQMYLVANVSLGKGGFARKTERTSIQKADIKQSGDETKKFWGLGGGKSGRN